MYFWEKKYRDPKDVLFVLQKNKKIGKLFLDMCDLYSQDTFVYPEL